MSDPLQESPAQTLPSVIGIHRERHEVTLARFLAVRQRETKNLACRHVPSHHAARVLQMTARWINPERLASQAHHVHDIFASCRLDHKHTQTWVLTRFQALGDP